jgi:hypothetical protein
MLSNRGEAPVLRSSAHSPYWSRKPWVAGEARALFLCIHSKLGNELLVGHEALGCARRPCRFAPLRVSLESVWATEVQLSWLCG